MTRRIARLVRAGWRADDRGMSVVELLVGMVISTLLLASVSAMVISGARTSDAANQRNQAVNELRIAADRMTKQLRTADSYDGNVPAIIVAEPQRIGFYAKLDTLDLTAANAGSQTQMPSVIWLWTRASADGKRELCQQVYRGTLVGANITFPAGAQSPGAARTCQVVARGLSATPPHSFFTYLKRTDATLNADGSSVSTVPVDGSGNVAAGDIPLVESVEIWMTAALRTQDTSKNPSTVARVTFINITSRSN